MPSPLCLPLSIRALCCAVLLAVGLCAGCGSEPASVDYPATEQGLLDYLDDVAAAYASNDADALHRLQADHCDASAAEVEKALSAAERGANSEFGVWLSDIFAHTEATVVDFDPDTATASAAFGPADSAPESIRWILEEDEDSAPARYEHRNGRWNTATGPGYCIAG